MSRMEAMIEVFKKSDLDYWVKEVQKNGGTSIIKKTSSHLGGVEWRTFTLFVDKKGRESFGSKSYKYRKTGYLEQPEIDYSALAWDTWDEAQCLHSL